VPAIEHVVYYKHSVTSQSSDPFFCCSNILSLHSRFCDGLIHDGNYESDRDKHRHESRSMERLQSWEHSLIDELVFSTIWLLDSVDPVEF